MVTEIVSSIICFALIMLGASIILQQEEEKNLKNKDKHDKEV